MTINAMNDQTDNSIRVEIYNQSYSIRSDGDHDYVLHLADYVDGKMREIASGTLTVDSLKVAILAALHIADELHQQQQFQSQNDAQLGARAAECSELLDRVLKHKPVIENREQLPS